MAALETRAHQHSHSSRGLVILCMLDSVGMSGALIVMVVQGDRFPLNEALSAWLH